MTTGDEDLRKALKITRLLREACNIWKTEGTGRRGAAGEKNEKVTETSDSEANNNKETQTNKKGKDRYPFLSVFLIVETNCVVPRQFCKRRRVQHIGWKRAIMRKFSTLHIW